jgi:hypothetical protein
MTAQVGFDAATSTDEKVLASSILSKSQFMQGPLSWPTVNFGGSGGPDSKSHKQWSVGDKGFVRRIAAEDIESHEINFKEQKLSEIFTFVQSKIYWIDSISKMFAYQEGTCRRALASSFRAVLLKVDEISNLHLLASKEAIHEEL